MPDETKDGWAADPANDGWQTDGMPPKAPEPMDDNATLRDLLARQAARTGTPSPAPTLPPALANLTAGELKQKIGVLSGAVTLFVTWVFYSLLGAAAGFAIDEFVVHGAVGLTGSHLWKAQALLAAPYIVLAFLGGWVAKARTSLPRPQAWAFALSAVYAISRLSRFRWCGPAAPIGDAVLARFLDAALVFAATQIGFGSASRRRLQGTDADRFGPGPIEP